MARFYADSDQHGESYILKSDGAEPDLKLDIGQVVAIVRTEAHDTRGMYDEVPRHFVPHPDCPHRGEPYHSDGCVFCTERRMQSRGDGG
jgi:hypothetical protein